MGSTTSPSYYTSTSPFRLPLSFNESTFKTSKWFPSSLSLSPPSWLSVLLPRLLRSLTDRSKEPLLLPVLLLSPPQLSPPPAPPSELQPRPPSLLPLPQLPPPCLPPVPHRLLQLLLQSPRSVTDRFRPPLPLPVPAPAPSAPAPAVFPSSRSPPLLLPPLPVSPVLLQLSPLQSSLLPVLLLVLSSFKSSTV